VPGALGSALAELESAHESVLAAAHAVEDDPPLRARLEWDADALSRLAREARAGDSGAVETEPSGIRAELASARNRLESVLGDD
jgi:hypothetical protein